MISYKPLFKTLVDRDLKKTDLIPMINCSSATLARFAKNEYVALEIIEKICIALNCKIEDVIEIIPSDK
jgi:DNA-binding Xre family transcriptional regulator